MSFFSSRWVEPPRHVKELEPTGLPSGFRAAGVAAGIKPSGNLDVGVLACDAEDAVSAARFTPNARYKPLFDDAPSDGRLNWRTVLPQGVTLMQVPTEQARDRAATAPVDRIAVLAAAHAPTATLLSVPADADLAEPVVLRADGIDAGTVVWENLLIEVGANARASNESTRPRTTPTDRSASPSSAADRVSSARASNPSSMPNPGGASNNTMHPSMTAPTDSHGQ